MNTFIRTASAATLALGLVASASSLASARSFSNFHNTATPFPGQSSMQNSMTPAPGMSSVPQGGAMNPGAHQGGDIDHFPKDPTPGPGNGGSGGGHNHGAGVSFGIYQNFDPNYFCRYIIHKHRAVKVCYPVQTSYAPAVSFSFGYGF